MAFDQPIEADRIDGPGFLSTFVRTPLWILGGVLGGNRSHSEDCDPVAGHMLDDSDSAVKQMSKPALGLHKRVLSTDDLTSAGLTEPDDSESNASEFDDPRPAAEIETVNGPGLTRTTKNLSWSDESGRNLVEYNDESVRREPSPYHAVTSTAAPRPVKSALRRTRSIRAEADGMGSDRTRYIPKMGSNQNGLVMPRPFGTEPPTNGVESPQLGYGWYTNLTPPTHEMYNGYRKAALGSHASSSSTVTAAKPCHNHVFENLQNSNVPMGWTSVPI